MIDALGNKLLSAVEQTNLNANTLPSADATPVLPPPDNSASASSATRDIPRLMDPMLSGVALEQLVEALGTKDRQNAVKEGLSSIDNKAKEMKQLNAEKLQKIQDNLAKMKEKEKLSPFLKAFKWIGMVLGTIASVASIAAGVVTANPLLIAGGVIGLTMSVNSILNEATDGKVSISAGVAEIAKACGADDDTAKWIGFGIEIAISLVGAGLSVAGAFSAASSATATVASKIVSYVALGTNIAGGATQIGQGGLQIASAVYDYDIARNQADLQEFQGILQRIQQAMDSEKDFIQAIMERFEELLGKVSDIVQDNVTAQLAVLTSKTPSMA